MNGHSFQGLVRRDPRVDCAAEKNDGRESHGGSQKQMEPKIENVTKRWTRRFDTAQFRHGMVAGSTQKGIPDLLVLQPPNSEVIECLLKRRLPSS